MIIGSKSGFGVFDGSDFLFSVFVSVFSGDGATCGTGSVLTSETNCGVGEACGSVVGVSIGVGLGEISGLTSGFTSSVFGDVSSFVSGVFSGFTVGRFSG